MMATGLDGMRASSRVSQDYLKTKGFCICGNLHAAPPAIARLIANSDGVT